MYLCFWISQQVLGNFQRKKQWGYSFTFSKWYSFLLSIMSLLDVNDKRRHCSPLIGRNIWSGFRFFYRTLYILYNRPIWNSILIYFQLTSGWFSVILFPSGKWEELSGLWPPRGFIKCDKQQVLSKCILVFYQHVFVLSLSGGVIRDIKF